MEITLREYQKKCIDTLWGKTPGRYLIQMATGLGKTVTFAQIEKYITGRMLILSHRSELVEQPEKYFDCDYGIEQGNKKSKVTDKVVSASVQSLVKRLNKFDRNYFEIIIVDEAHHTPAKTYQKILNHFTPKYVFGFTATPSRGDKIGLDKCYDEIIFQRDLRWGILEKYLCDIECKRVDIGYSLKGIKSNGSDFIQKQLEEMVNIEKANKAIAETFYKYARGQTIIFGVSVDHCKGIQEQIPGSIVIDGKTKKDQREQLIKDFTARKFQCLINCMVFTEGTDIPLIETVIIARPTKNASLYTQMVGRGLRTAPEKDKLLLIDCVGASSLNICSAPTLLGLKMDNIPQKKELQIEGDLFDLESIIEIESDNPESWIKNVKTVNLWAKDNSYNTYGVNYFKLSNGDLMLKVPGVKKILLKKPDELGLTEWRNEKVHIQSLFDKVYKFLIEDHSDKRYIWDLEVVNKWAKKPASQAQLNHIRNKFPDLDISKLDKGKASQILNRVFN